MHASSLENMHECYQRHIVGSPLETAERVVVLDVGGADVNGSYRDVFAGPRFTYIGADLTAGAGVDIVIEDPNRLPFDDASVDIVVSGQMLEHCAFFWLMFAEMIRVLRPSGYLFLIAPSAGPEHRYPIDCYRFYPDAYRALARYANCDLVEVWLDERGPWRDLVGVFRRRQLPRKVPGPAAPPAFDPRKDVGRPEEEATAGDTPYLEVLASLHEALQPDSYLEIGIRHGGSLSLARCPAIGVDPAPALAAPAAEGTRVFPMTSDAFFATAAATAVPRPPDLVFIDGMHLFEYALRDFMNVERRSSPTTLVVIDDIMPNHPAQAARDRRTRAWTGDVWKLHACLRHHRPNLVLLPIDASPTGLLLVAGLDPKDRTLWDGYNPIVRQYASAPVPPPEVLQRRGALSGRHPLIGEAAALLRAARRDGAGNAVTGALRAAVARAAP